MSEPPIPSVLTTRVEALPKRRTRTKAPGVYRSSSGAYEIAYRDSDGRLVFRVIRGGFEDAKAARAEIVGKLSRGEPVRRTKVAFGEFSEAIFGGMSGRPRTLQKHRYHLDKHLLPRFRNRMIGEISTDDVARLIGEMQRGIHFVKVDGRLVRERRDAGYAGWTTSGVVSTLGLILGKAKRRGLIPANPVSDLERGERPKLAQVEKRVLDNTQIEKLLSEAGSFRPLIAVLIFSGLRLGEALGLQWCDIDDGFLHVRRQLGRDRQAAEIKTEAGRRAVVLMPQLASVLTTHKLASRHSQSGDYVFPAPAGGGRDHRSTSKGIERAVNRAGLGSGISAHSFRHTFASQLIVGLGLDPVRVSRLLGHTSPAFTASTYAHMFEQSRHADELRERMADGYGRLLEVKAT
jgi:integrase